MKITHANNIISQIKNLKTRNLLRGIIGETDSFKIKKSLKKIKSSNSLTEYKKALEIIRASELFENNSVSRDFNKVCPRLMPEVVKYTENEIIDKINLNEDQISNLISMYRNLLICAQERKFDESLRYCHLIIEYKGVSVSLIKILFYLKIQAENFKNIRDAIESVFSRIEINNARYLDNAIKQLSSSKTDYFNICKKINGSDSKTSLSYIAKDFISHVTKDEEIYLIKVSAYYSFSLLDSFLYICSSKRLNLPFVSKSKTIKSSLVDSFDSLRKITLNQRSYTNKIQGNLDLELFRECFLILELDECFKYKTIHGAFYVTNKEEKIVRIPAENKLLTDYFENVKSLSDLCSNERGTDGISLDKFDSNNCSCLDNSSALLYCIEINDANIYDEGKFIELMSYTMDIGFTCPSQYLQKIINNAESDELKLVLACLMSIKDKSQIIEHNLRKVIQEIAVQKFDSKIQNLIEYIFTISPSVTQHLIKICDETFLSKLFHVTDKPNTAIESRAEMLEWYGNKTDEPVYIERGKNLRTDVQINKEKGMIDDSRIYVDPLKFTQWINDNIITDLNFLLEVNTNKIGLSTISIDWPKVNSGISNNEQIASLLLVCYSEFCKNNLFGIASYLGRRIRHGTFKGEIRGRFPF
jgi:hypothetical protein